MKKNKSLFVLILLFAGFVSCESWFSTDISKKEVVILSPHDGILTNINTQLFWWESIEDASEYTLQIVSPDFDSIEYLVADTNLSGNKFESYLSPGEYEWRVKAINEAYETDYTYSKLWIDSSQNLGELTVFLQSPTDMAYISDTIVDFSWNELSAAEDYRFEVHYENWDDNLVQPPLVTSETETSVSIEEGTYAWGVQALNQSSSTPFTTRAFVIDTTSPLSPLPLFPVSDTIFESELPQPTYSFSWSHQGTSLAPYMDSLEVYSDTEMQTRTHHTYTSDTTHSFYNGVEFGTLYWRVKSTDMAGNQGEWSELKSFVYEE